MYKLVENFNDFIIKLIKLFKLNSIYYYFCENYNEKKTVCLQ